MFSSHILIKSCQNTQQKYFFYEVGQNMLKYSDNMFPLYMQLKYIFIVYFDKNLTNFDKFCF